jgi:hypothetical protein
MGGFEPPSSPAPKAGGVTSPQHPVIVIPEGLEPPPRGPKPRVLPLDQWIIYGFQYFKELYFCWDGRIRTYNLRINSPPL